MNNNNDENNLVDENPLNDPLPPEPKIEEVEKFEYTSRSEEELKQIAMDIYHNRVFTDRHVKNAQEVGMVFMPLIFMSRAQHLGMYEIFGMIFEYYENALPSSINGLPLFMSFRFLDKNDSDKVNTFYTEYKEMQDEIKTKWGGQNLSGIKEGDPSNINVENVENNDNY